MSDKKQEEYRDFINSRIKDLNPLIKDFIKRNPGSEKLFLIDDENFVNIAIESANQLFKKLEPQAREMSSKMASAVKELNKKPKTDSEE